MTKFKIVEIRQKVQEDTKLQQIGNRTATALQSLANIGRMFGVRSEFLTTMVNLVSSAIAPFKRKTEYTDDDKKVIRGLLSNSSQVDGVIQRSLGLDEIPPKLETSTDTQVKRQPKRKKNEPMTDEEFANALAKRRKQIDKVNKRKRK